MSEAERRWWPVTTHQGCGFPGWVKGRPFVGIETQLEKEACLRLGAASLPPQFHFIHGISRRRSLFPTLVKIRRLITAKYSCIVPLSSRQIVLGPSPSPDFLTFLIPSLLSQTVSSPIIKMAHQRDTELRLAATDGLALSISQMAAPLQKSADGCANPLCRDGIKTSRHHVSIRCLDHLAQVERPVVAEPTSIDDGGRPVAPESRFAIQIGAGRVDRVAPVGGEGS